MSTNRMKRLALTLTGLAVIVAVLSDPTTINGATLLQVILLWSAVTLLVQARKQGEK